MCEAGRVLHHLKASVEDPKNAVLIVGFQAPHTLGRRILEHRPRVKIFGVERDLRAEVVVMNGFSAHADQRDLVDFVTQAKQGGRLKQVLLVYGDPDPQKKLADLIRANGATGANGIGQVAAPAAGDRVTV
jgi:metallo-beta-lactamase family protein